MKCIPSTMADTFPPSSKHNKLMIRVFEEVYQDKKHAGLEKGNISRKERNNYFVCSAILNQ